MSLRFKQKFLTKKVKFRQIKIFKNMRCSPRISDNYITRTVNILNNVEYSSPDFFKNSIVWHASNLVVCRFYSKNLRSIAVRNHPSLLIRLLTSYFSNSGRFLKFQKKIKDTHHFLLLKQNHDDLKTKLSTATELLSTPEKKDNNYQKKSHLNFSEFNTILNLKDIFNFFLSDTEVVYTNKFTTTEGVLISENTYASFFEFKYTTDFLFEDNGFEKIKTFAVVPLNQTQRDFSSFKWILFLLLSGGTYFKARNSIGYFNFMFIEDMYTVWLQSFKEHALRSFNLLHMWSGLKSNANTVLFCMDLAPIVFNIKYYTLNRKMRKILKGVRKHKKVLFFTKSDRKIKQNLNHLKFFIKLGQEKTITKNLIWFFYSTQTQQRMSTFYKMHQRQQVLILNSWMTKLKNNG